MIAEVRCEDQLRFGGKISWGSVEERRFAPRQPSIKSLRSGLARTVAL
jgi:hypothetical protein